RPRVSADRGRKESSQRAYLRRPCTQPARSDAEAVAPVQAPLSTAMFGRQAKRFARPLPDLTQATLIAAEVNVVLARRLWPRSLVSSQLASADEHSYRGKRRRTGTAGDGRCSVPTAGSPLSGAAVRVSAH